MSKFIINSFLFPVILSIVVSIFFIPFFYANNSNIIYKFDTSIVSEDDTSSFSWPTPFYKNITSGFGYRKSPATGASSYHGGIDIGAAQGSKIYATLSGKISYVGFNGANGYTVKIKHANGYETTYGHVSPDFVVSVGDYVQKGQYIANVGPKYVEKKPYTTYMDSFGKCTNGATTGPHLHFAISKDGKRINPLSVF